MIYMYANVRRPTPPPLLCAHSQRPEEDSRHLRGGCGSGVEPPAFPRKLNQQKCPESRDSRPVPEGWGYVDI